MSVPVDDGGVRRVRQTTKLIGEWVVNPHDAATAPGRIAFPFVRSGQNLGQPEGVALWEQEFGRWQTVTFPAYGYACALTGYRLTTITANTIVDAAHIHQFADSRNNDATNGMALCKNAHWLFDQGLWSLTDDYRVIVAVGRFTEECPDQKGLLNYHGGRVRLPTDQSLWPNPIHLAWHRESKLQKA